MIEIFQLSAFVNTTKKAVYLQKKIRVGKLSQYIQKYKIEEKMTVKIQKENPSLDTASLEFHTKVLEAIQNNNERIGIPSAGKTREWINTFVIFKWLLDNKHHVQRLANDVGAKNYLASKRRADWDPKTLINSDRFWKKLKEIEVWFLFFFFFFLTNVQAELEPLKKGTLILQSDKRNLSDVFEVFRGYRTHFETSKSKKKILEILDEKWNLIEDPIILASWFLDNGL